MSLDLEPDRIYKKEEIDLNNIIAHTQKVRIAIIDKLTNNGTLVPDAKSLRLLLETLRDSDNTALIDKKLNNDNQQNKTNEKIAETIAEITSKLTTSIIGNLNNGNNKAEELEKTLELPEINVNPGEDEIGITSEDCKTFMEKMNQKK